MAFSIDSPTISSKTFLRTIFYVNEIGEYLIRKNEAISNGISERAFILEELAIIRRLRIRYIFTNRNFPKSKMDLLKFINQDLEKYINNTSNIANIDDNLCSNIVNTDVTNDINNNISSINHNSNTFDNNISITNVENTDIINDLDNNIPNIDDFANITNNFHVPNVHNTENVPNFDTLSTVPLDSDCRIDVEKFSYVRIEAGNNKKFDLFGIIKSNTGYYRCPIPFENAMKIEENLNFANYLRLYIGYIEHIPD